MMMRMKLLIGALSAMPFLAGAAIAGDPEAGEDLFKRCKSCHAITADDGTKIMKGGKTGPNLYGVIGRQIGALEGFKFGASLASVGADGTVWDEETLAAYITDPKAWLKETLGDSSAKSKMTFKLKKGADDMAAYLAGLTAE